MRLPWLATGLSGSPESDWQMKNVSGLSNYGIQNILLLSEGKGGNKGNSFLDCGDEARENGDSLTAAL